MLFVPTALLALCWFAAADNLNDTLPDDVWPVSYELHVATDLERSTFTGRACITVRTALATCRVTMNAAAGMLVAVVRVTERDTGRPLTVAWHRLTANDQRLTVELHGAEHTRKCLLPHRPYVVDVHYESALRDDGVGYHRGSYAENGRNKYAGRAGSTRAAPVPPPPTPKRGRQPPFARPCAKIV